jgi:hypothetical protein
LTPGRRAVAAALCFAVAAILAGIDPRPDGAVYHVFGLPAGVFALLLTYLLVLRGVWPQPLDATSWLAVGYGTLAGAQLLELLFPPPGALQWVVLVVLAMTAWGALGSGTRTRIVASLGSLALLLAVIKFSVVPVLLRVGPEAGTGLGLGDLAEGGRRFLAEAPPTGPAGQLTGFAALCLWALATRLVWPPARESVALVRVE